MKLKEFGPPGGARVPGAPLDPPLSTILFGLTLYICRICQDQVPKQRIPGTWMARFCCSLIPTTDTVTYQSRSMIN